MQLFLVMTTAYTHQQGGLTLVEALTALAILSILAAIALPSSANSMSAGRSRKPYVPWSLH